MSLSNILFRTSATFLALSAATSAYAFNPASGDLSKDNPDYVRVLVYNLERFWIDGGTPAQVDQFDRIMQAVNPDVICLQELLCETSSVNDIEPHLNQLLGGSWESNTGECGGIKNAVISRYPLLDDGNDSVPDSATRGLTWALIDLPDETYSTDLYGISVHFKAGSTQRDEDLRQQSGDAAANWFADLTTPGGFTGLPTNTPIFLTGDTNVRTSGLRTEQPWGTILTGNILDNATYGADRTGDWDGTEISDFLVRDVYTLDSDTHPSRQTSPSNRLDRIAYTDSVMKIAQAFVLNTRNMNAQQLAANNLSQFDTDVSDHYPLVFDLAVGGIEVTEPEYGDILVTELMPNPSFASDLDGEYFELHNWTETSYNLNGYTVLTEFNGPQIFDGASPDLINPGDYNVYTRNASFNENGNIEEDRAFPDIVLPNAGGFLELWRGSIKIDGVRYGDGEVGTEPENVFWAQTVSTARSFIMEGDLSNGRTSTYGLSAEFYNPIDQGTPGEPNFLKLFETDDFFMIN